MNRLWVVVLVAACGGTSSQERGPSAIPAHLAPGEGVELSMDALEKQRVAGAREPRLSDLVQLEFVRQQNVRPDLRLRLCLDPQGAPTTVDVVKSSGQPGADEEVMNGVWAWRFSPTVIDGEARRVCGPATFRYRINAPSLPPPVD